MAKDEVAGGDVRPRPCPFCGDPMVLEMGLFGHTGAEDLPPLQFGTDEAAEYINRHECILHNIGFPESLLEKWNTRPQ